MTGRPSAKVRDRSISHRRGARRLGQFALRTGLELLENRITPTGNIAITNALVVDASGQSLECDQHRRAMVYIQADFTTQDLPADASYVVGYTVNGLTQDTGALTLGAGSSGTGSFDANWGGFIATPGTNQVTVTVDPDHSVPETTYADNTMSFTFDAVVARGGKPLVHGGADPRGLRARQHSRLRLGRGRRIGTDDCPRRSRQ